MLKVCMINLVKQKKSAAVIIILILLFLCSAILFSCNNDSDKGREAFYPESGEYKVMLKPEEWELIRYSDNIDTLALQHKETNIIFIIEFYKKTNVADVNVSDFESFIKFYKLFDYVKGIYENENNTVEEAVEIPEKDMKNTQIKTGKKQKINITGDPELILEYIYLETADYYFVVNFTVPNANYTDEVKKAADEVIFNIQKIEV